MATPSDVERLGELLASGLASNHNVLDELKLAWEYEEAARKARTVRRRELPSDVDPHDLSQTGWGVIWTAEDAPMVRHCLRRLLDHSRKQAGSRYRELIYRPPELARTFLWNRHGVAPGTLDTARMPYYLLIVGDPETIPFEFQHQLSINHAVGRVHCDDPRDYERYAASVVEAEAKGVSLPPEAVIFAVDDGGLATTRLRQHLVEPLEQRLASGDPQWQVEVWRGERASKQALGRLLGGDRTPALLLAACHGRECTPGDPRQEDRQGALVCQPPPGGGRGSAFYGADVGEDARLRGQIAFFFACYGAGTPLEDNFPHQSQPDGGGDLRPEPLALKPFVARLPKVLLSRGALAVVGHLDRGWTLSFSWELRGQPGEAVLSLEDSLRQLLSGHRLGHALRPLYRRYTALAAQLVDLLERLGYGEKVDKENLARMWTAHNDARNFIILGDPAVYLLGRGKSA